MQFDWWTLALQTVNVIVLIWLLQRFLLKPVLGLIARRRQEVERAFEEAALEKEQARETERRLESQQQQLSERSEGVLAESHARARAAYSETVEKGQHEAKELMETERRRIEDERRDALIELRDKAFDLSVDLARQLLSELDPATVGHAFLASIEHFLGSLPADELEALRHQIAQGVAPRVVTASPLEQGEKKHWFEMLAGLLGKEAEIRFETDDALIAGAELHIRNVVIRFNWRDKLAAARKALSDEEEVDADADGAADARART